MELFHYEILFSVNFKHDYYKTGYSPDFTVVPSRVCRNMLNKNRMLFKETHQGFVVLGDVEKAGTDYVLKRGIADDLKLTFLMKLKNPYFTNYTDIPFSKDESMVYYFNNLEDHESDGELRLADKNEIPKSASNATLIKKKPKYYSHLFNGSGPEKTAVLTFIDEGFYISQTASEDAGKYHFNFDLSSYDPGRCELSVDGSGDRFYFAGDSYGEDVFGIIEVFNKPSVPAGYRLVNGSGVIQSREYIIPFTNRRTIWRYYVYDKFSNTLNNPLLSMNGYDFGLESFTNSNYPEEYGLYKFTSGVQGSPDTEAAIPLTEKKIKNIKLTGEINGMSKDIIPNMPNPDVRIVKPEIATGKIYSDMIIYV